MESAGGVTGEQTVYYIEDGVILGEYRYGAGTKSIVYQFDESGRRLGFTYNGTQYYYRHNLQGDVIAIVDRNADTVAKYTYDAWGKVLAVTNASSVSQTSSTFIGNINPIRYRGYYYDTDLGLYYLQSRYYDPETGRFLNADGYVQTGDGLMDKNMFAYCMNDPVNRKDPTGQFWITALIVTAVVVACAVTFSGCSSQPMSDVGAAQPYVDMPGSDNPSSPNCYAYAIGSPVNEQPGGTSGRTPTKWNDVNDVGKSVEADLKAKGYTVREISGPNAKVYDNEFKIALRVGTQPYAYNRYTGQL